MSKVLEHSMRCCRHRICGSLLPGSVRHRGTRWRRAGRSPMDLPERSLQSDERKPRLCLVRAGVSLWTSGLVGPPRSLHDFRLPGSIPFANEPPEAASVVEPTWPILSSRGTISSFFLELSSFWKISVLDAKTPLSTAFGSQL